MIQVDEEKRRLEVDVLDALDAYVQALYDAGSDPLNLGPVTRAFDRLMDARSALRVCSRAKVLTGLNGSEQA